MTASAYYLVGFNGMDKPLSAGDMAGLQINHEDTVSQTRLSSLLSDKGADISSFLLCDKGVIIRGMDMQYASAISMAIASHPALSSYETQIPMAAPDMKRAFNVAAAEWMPKPAITGPRRRVMATANIPMAPIAIPEMEYAQAA